MNVRSTMVLLMYLSSSYPICPLLILVVKDCPVFDELAEYTRLVAGASLTGARILAGCGYQFSISWDGGRLHIIFLSVPCPYILSSDTTHGKRVLLVSAMLTIVS